MSTGALPTTALASGVEYSLIDSPRERVTNPSYSNPSGEFVPLRAAPKGFPVSFPPVSPAPVGGKTGSSGSLYHLHTNYTKSSATPVQHYSARLEQARSCPGYGLGLTGRGVLPGSDPITSSDRITDASPLIQGEVYSFNHPANSKRFAWDFKIG